MFLVLGKFKKNILLVKVYMYASCHDFEVEHLITISPSLAVLPIVVVVVVVFWLLFSEPVK